MATKLSLLGERTKVSMRNSKNVERYRHCPPHAPEMKTAAADGMNGVFLIPIKNDKKQVLYCLFAIVSDGRNDPEYPWEHVSVTVASQRRTPTWEEMCMIKDLFWEDDECVMQLHPSKADWISQHPFCLHLWRPLDLAIPLPPSMAVGVKGASGNATIPDDKARELIRTLYPLPSGAQ